MPSIASIFMLIFFAVAVPISQAQQFWRDRRITGIIKVAVLAVLFVITVMTVPTSEDNQSKRVSNEVQNIQDKRGDHLESKSEIKPEPEMNKINRDFNISEHRKLAANILYEYGGYMLGEKIVTVATVSNVSRGKLSANTESDEAPSYRPSFKFNDKEAVDWVEDGAILTIAGIISDNNSSVSSITIENCTIIGEGGTGAGTSRYHR